MKIRTFLIFSLAPHCIFSQSLCLVFDVGPVAEYAAVTYRGEKVFQGYLQETRGKKLQIVILLVHYVYISKQNLLCINCSSF